VFTHKLESARLL